MPVRVSQQQQHHHSSTSLNMSTPNGSSYSLHRDSPTSSIRDDASSTSSLSLDGRQRKRLHKNPQEPTTFTRKPSLREPRSPPKPQTTRRQNNVARGGDPKRPLMSRPIPDFSQPKPNRSSDTTLASSSSTSSTFTNNNANFNDQLLPTAEPAKSNVTTFYAFGNSKAEEEERQAAMAPEGLDDPFEFQPSVNLEDVHRGIIDNEQLNAFPTPSRKVSGGSMSDAASSTRGGTNASRGLPQNTPTGPAAGTQAGSLLRRPSVSTKYAGLQNNREQIQQQARGGRRQSVATGTNAPQSSTSSTLRKSMATVEPADSLRGARKRPSMVGPSSLNPPMPRKEYHPDGGYSSSRSTAGQSDGGVKIPISSRSAKSKSLQPPPRQAQNHISNPNLTPEQFRASVAYPPKSPKSPSIHKNKNGTPGSGSSRRISMMPHASGLAARTISPTDARRLKRLSMLNTPPPPSMPINLESSRSTPGSPSMIPRKRSSRLPRPPQMDRDDDEIPPVPPLPKNLQSPMEPSSGESSLVPSYENTPLNTVKSTNSSLYGPRKSSLAVETAMERIEPVDTEQNDSDTPSTGSSAQSRVKSSSSVVYTPRKSSMPADNLLGLELPDPSAEPEMFHLESFDAKLAHPNSGMQPRKTDKETRRKRGMTLGPGSMGSGGFHSLEQKSSSSSLRGKGQNLAPIRLPPLNLLPLSTPTIARMDALSHTTSDELTPPRKLGNRTPQTPMTASKASFFGNERNNLDHQRSMSSINHTMASEDSPSSLSLRAGSSASSGIPVSNSSRMGRQTISPYISSSLPKGSAAIDDGKDKKLPVQTPREKSRTRQSQDSLRNGIQAEDVSESPAPGGSNTSIRRKLSLSWKKGSQGKNSHAATERAEEYQAQVQPQKYDAMPPPKLPNSHTWSSGTPSPSKAPNPPAAQANRRKSSTGNSILFGQHDRTRSDSWGALGSPKKEKKVEEKAPAPPAKQSTSGSILGPMQKMLGSKGSLGQLRNRHNHQPPVNTDPNLDSDDLIAEEEMRKISSKRKNLDQAAAQLDELKRRANPKDRVAPHIALRQYNLNIYEKGEIVDFKDVYFTGLPDAKKHVGDLKTPNLPNFGYDDDRGDYSIIKGDHLSYRYEIVDILGKGSFGQVVRCIDHKTGGLVAIKIIRNKKRFHQQALVEVNILQKLKEWDPQQKHSLINFTQSFYFRGHLCISTELLGMNLYEFIKSNDFRGFSLKLIRRFTKQMLSSLKLLKGHKVIHCDLKPENILLAHPAHTEIKVIDFGSSCFETEKVYTYIQSRFYRSPEVILGMSYGLPIDVWSLGCILAELFTGYPIFPGENEQEQLACIMEVFGPPEKHLIEKSTRRKLFFDSQGKPRMIVSSKGRRRRPSSKTLQHALKCDDEAFLDFVSRCLRWDPEKRLKPDEAMNHEFITGRKMSSRTRSGNYASATAASDSKERRYTAYSRPLPDPPANTTTSTSRKPPVANNASPMKAPAHTTITNTNASNTGSYRRANPTAGSKRNSIGAPVGGSALPRVAATVGQRSVSGKHYGAANSGGTSSSGGRTSTTGTARGGGAGTSGSVRLLRDEENATSSGGEGIQRRR
ncbi:hypothetical protein EDC01DRAFT_409890 [Geopyxis carbonaria]|nr:hypothetical protein EDC01DRAFT_409890 [Geopyxis carbonaria]